jgi:alpha-glucosidase
MSLIPAWLPSVHHDGSPQYVSHLTPKLGETVGLRLRAAATAPIKRVLLRTFPDGEQMLTVMQPAAATPHTQWWEVDLPIREPLVHYRFVIEAEDGVWWYTAAGPLTLEPRDISDFRILADYHVPSWLHQAIFYQIFPDRFADGQPESNPRPEEYEYRGARPRTYPWETPPDQEQPFSLVFYGGDLPGITAHLDYLQALGVNTLYLNPIFTAYSNHKYDVADYEHVDPHLGGNEALIELAEALHQRGMRYILDIVPNHCGYWHPWFQTARTDPTAPEVAYFTFHNHPDDYESWLGVWSLPKLNYQSEALRGRVYTNPDAVFRNWLREPFHADGWRVDVANMLGRQGAIQLGITINQGIRQAVKETNPEAYLVGENFFDASPQLQGDQLDGVMNYMGFTIPLWHWLNQYYLNAHGLREPVHSTVPYPTSSLIATWLDRLSSVPWVITLQQYNQLDSHDVPRLRTIVGENDALHRLAVMVQFTMPGLPAVYYGDEIGMVNDPVLAQRGCMVWDESRWDNDLLAFHRALIALRKASPTLQTGGFQMLLVEPDSFAYQREGDRGRVLVIAHRSSTPRPAAPLPIPHANIPDGTRFREFFTGQEMVAQNGQLPLPTLPQGATLWLAE